MIGDEFSSCEHRCPSVLSKILEDKELFTGIIYVYPRVKILEFYTFEE